MIRIPLLFIVSFICISVFSQDFVYKPINPAFGGETFNYQWLLSSAQAQNTITEKSDDIDPFEQDPIEDFEKSLNRQILSQLSRQLIYNQFGEGGLTEGHYELGSYQIDVIPGDTGIEIQITDITTGSETKVTVPYF
ncbi:MAG: curli production assembly/transport component CsgF [bacterium]